MKSKIMTAAAFAVLWSLQGSARTLVLVSDAGGQPIGFDDKAFKLDGSGDNIVWNNDGQSVYKASALNCNFGANVGVFKMKGVELYPTWMSAFGIASATELEIGDGGFYFNSSNGSSPDIYGDGTINLTASQSWRCGNAATQRGSIVFDGTPKLRYTSGISWTLSGPFDVNVATALGLSEMAEVQVQQAAHLVVGENGSLNATTVIVDGSGSQLVLNAVAKPKTGYLTATEVKLANGGALVCSATAPVDAGQITVTAGTGTIQGTFLPGRSSQPIKPMSGSTLVYKAATVFPAALDQSFYLNGGGGTLEVQSGFMRISSISAFTGNIKVTGGTLQIPNVGILPSGKNIIVEAGEVLVETITGSENTRIVCSGTGKWSQPVMATPRSEMQITVRAGETLHVQGNGLSAATKVRLDGGTLAFERSATVASRLEIPTNAVISVAGDGLVATLTGYVDATNTYNSTYTENITQIATFAVSGSGTAVFSGGGRFDMVNFYAQNYGSIQLRGNTWRFCRAHLGVMGGLYFGVLDGATVNCEWAQQGGIFLIRTNGPFNTGLYGTFEIGSGSKVVQGENRRLYLGEGNYYGRLLVSGGTYQCALGRDIYVYGYRNVIDFHSGLVDFNNSFSYDANDKMLVFNWYGGVWRINSGFGGVNFESNGFDGVFTMANMMTLNIAGSDCMLDLGGRETLKMVNEVNDDSNSKAKKYKTAPVFNAVGENVRLTVTNCSTFVANFLPTSNCTLRVACGGVVMNAASVSRPEVSSVRGVELAWPDAVISADHPVTVEDMYVTKTAVWPPAGAGANISVVNLAFEDGCTLGSSPEDEPFTISGVLTLPTSLNLMITDPVSSKDIIRAASVVGKVPKGAILPGSRTRKLMLVGGTLCYRGRGCACVYK